MDFNEYQQKAHKTAIYDRRSEKCFDIYTSNGKYLGRIPAYPFLKIGTEANEVSEDIIKVMFRGDDKKISQEELIKEIGDVLWYCAENATNLSMTLEEIAEENIKKLQDREKRGVIKGSGDNR